jgi:hypothetical protein
LGVETCGVNPENRVAGHRPPGLSSFSTGAGDERLRLLVKIHPPCRPVSLSPMPSPPRET